MFSLCTLRFTIREKLPQFQEVQFHPKCSSDGLCVVHIIRLAYKVVYISGQSVVVTSYEQTTRLD